MPFTGILIDRHSMPDHLPCFEERVVRVAVVLFDESEQIIDDGPGCYGAFVVAVVVEKAVQDDVLQALPFMRLYCRMAIVPRRSPGCPGAGSVSSWQS